MVPSDPSFNAASSRRGGLAATLLATCCGLTAAAALFILGASITADAMSAPESPAAVIRSH